MITFETHNYFLEKGSFLSRVLESFPDSLLVSVRPVFLPPEAENLRKKIKGATSKDYLCVSKNLGCLNSHSNPWVWDTCLSLCLTNDRLMLIKKSPEVWKRPFLWKFLFDRSSPLTIHGCYLSHRSELHRKCWRKCMTVKPVTPGIILLILIDISLFVFYIFPCCRFAQPFFLNSRWWVQRKALSFIQQTTS